MSETPEELLQCLAATPPNTYPREILVEMISRLDELVASFLADLERIAAHPESSKRYRGLLFRIVEESLGSWIAVVVSSLVFGISHLLNPQASITGALSISVEAGLLLAAAYLVTRRLWLSIGFHMAWNYTQSAIFSGIVSGGDSDPGLVKATLQGSDVLTGGTFGLESSLVAFLLCTTAGAVLLMMAVRRGNVVVPFWKRKA